MRQARKDPSESFNTWVGFIFWWLWEVSGHENRYL